MVENGFEGIVSNIINSKADIVTFSEVRNYNDTDFIANIIKELKGKGYIYYGEFSSSTGIISKYPILNQIIIYPDNSSFGTIIKSYINVKGSMLAIYASHLDYTHYACYLPRGYDGSTWEKIENPIIDPDTILSQNRKSKRLDAINAFILDAKHEIEKGNIVIIGGDFNEPSHLDWTEQTKYLWDHNGAVVEWEVSKALLENGFRDSYRECNPDVINYPGFTFPSDNPNAEISKLSWAPGTDERDRIDFIYYYPSSNISLTESILVGPSKSIYYSQRKEEHGKDIFLSPVEPWPSDHKAVLSTFKIIY